MLQRLLLGWKNLASHQFQRVETKTIALKLTFLELSLSFDGQGMKMGKMSVNAGRGGNGGEGGGGQGCSLTPNFRWLTRQTSNVKRQNFSGELLMSFFQ